MTPCEKGEAKYAKAIFDDGDTLWLRLDRKADTMPVDEGGNPAMDALPEALTLYRGMRGEKWREMLNAMRPGTVFQDKGAMTLAADSAMVDNLDVVMEVRVPAGARGVGHRGSYLFEPGRKLKLKSFDGRHKAVFEMLA